MTKTKLVFIAMALALVAWAGASPASAQEVTATMSVTPTNVAEAGEHTFTVTSSGWTVSIANVLTCKIPEGGNGAEIDTTTHCQDFANLGLDDLTPVTVTDGGFEVSITITVPEQGIFIIAGDAGRTEAANAVLITVGAAEEEPAEEEPAEEEPAEEEPAEEEPAEEEPGTIVEVAVGSGDFPTLVAAVQAAGLVDTLSGEGPFTVFAPTEDAFAAALAALEMSAEDLLGNTELLTSVLTYHVLPISAPAETVLGLDGQGVATVHGAEVQISIDGDTVMVNNATVVATDIKASNGIIHVIDAVLLPPADDMPADDMADDMPADDMADDMPADDMADDMPADDMADDMADDEMLADTGSNAPLLAIVALAVVLAGAMMLGLSRRLRTQ